PFYLLIPQNTDLLGEYEQGWKITDVMPVNSTGVKTHRDHFVIDFDAEILKSRIAEFRDLNIPDEVIAQRYSLSDTRDWKINTRRRSLAANQDWENYLTKCLYRPFDIRDYYHHQDVVELPRHEVMKHIVNHENLGLIFMRQVAIQEGYNHFLVTNSTVDNRAFYSNKGTMQLAPLYLYPVGEATPLEYRTEITQERRPNFSPQFLKTLTAQLGHLPSPETIFYYIYAVFHSPTYRRRYAEFLKIDFPRVPLTSRVDLFQQLATHGEALVALHLMQSSRLDALITHYEGNPHPIVDAGHPKFIPHPLAPSPKGGEGEQDSLAPLSHSGRGVGGEGGNVILNKKGDGFIGVPEAVWNFYVGGYQVCQKWLKDRKGRTLSPDDLTHYQRIIVALKETIRLMQQIDEAIPGWPLE
ncbi:MAG: type ISP restriction/modification enzyme, partial [Nodosilinea sp.]